MRVGYLIPEFPGQTHIWMWREIVHMRRWGVDVHLFSTRRPPDRDKARHDWADDAAASCHYLWPIGPAQLAADAAWALAHPGRLTSCIKLARSLKVTNCDPIKLIPPAIRLARLAKQKRLDHLHVHSCAGSSILAMHAKRLADLPYSLTLNANLEWWGGEMGRKFGESAFTVAITRWLYDQVREQMPHLREDQLILGRIGVDTDKWTPGDPPNNDTPQLIIVGRLHESKGHAVLLDALAKVPGAALTIVGDGPERPAIEKQIDSLGLTERVALTGSVAEDQIIGLMRGADLFVAPSHAEPLGVVYMEAMAMGVATIGTAAGGVAEIIDSGKDGLLVPPRDPDALASAIQQLIDDPARRRAIAQAGRESVVRNFDARIGAATLYERLHGEPPADIAHQRADTPTHPTAV
ncbi:MAG: glycosyltransferase family 4 protein [Phycisphaeraceae bacterium]